MFHLCQEAKKWKFRAGFLLPGISKLLCGLLVSFNLGLMSLGIKYSSAIPGLGMWTYSDWYRLCWDWWSLIHYGLHNLQATVFADFDDRRFQTVRGSGTAIHDTRMAQTGLKLALITPLIDWVRSPSDRYSEWNGGVLRLSISVSKPWQATSQRARTGC